MFRRGGIEPIDYLVVGHISLHDDPEGAQLGGTAAYSALTAQVLDRQVGVVTSLRDETSLGRFGGIAIANTIPSADTIFEDYHPREEPTLKLISRAEDLDYHQIPELWSRAPIVHLAPIVQEIPISMMRQFEGSFLGLTPKGWLRSWDASGRIGVEPWPEADFALRFADAVVLSEQDIEGSEEITAEMATASKVLVITRGRNGASVYTMGEEHIIQAPEVDEIDATGAGDIFAAAFFCSLHATGDALGAARFAGQLAALSVTRRGLESVPTKDEIYDLTFEVH